MLHQQAHSRDTNPAAKPHKDRFSSGFHKLDDVGVQADCRHCHDNKEFLISFKGLVTAAGRWKTVVTTEASKKNSTKKGKIFFRLTFAPSALCLSRRVRTNASTSVIGMIASVRVSLTIAAASSVLLPWIPSQACAAAVTEEDVVDRRAGK